MRPDSVRISGFLLMFIYFGLISLPAALQGLSAVRADIGSVYVKTRVAEPLRASNRGRTGAKQGHNRGIIEI